VPLHVVYTVFAGGVAGCLGALLGLGGGVFLVPFLNAVLGLPFSTAAGVSLVTVIATSSVVSSNATGRQLINYRLGMVLEVFTVLGATSGVYVLTVITEHQSERVFGAVTVLIAIAMLGRIGRRNVIRDPSTDVGLLGGRFYEEESGGEVAYRIRRLPVACGVSYVAGIVSTIVGIGGGILKVPALNSWCGMPMRAAAATSAFMIGVTATVGAIAYYARGQIVPDLAAAAVLGVLAGSKFGFWISGHSRVRGLKILMAGVLLLVAVEYLFFKP
jgi:uncharacterized protein